MGLHQNLANAEGYLARMNASAREKARIADYIPAHAGRVLDVGCADGAITRVLAEALPQAVFLGIDLDTAFIAHAEHDHALPRISYEATYLRDLLTRPERYNAVTFISVLHEFYTYGEGTSSVVKAIADAHELLLPGGEIVIRDMIPHRYSRTSETAALPLIQKIRANSEVRSRVADFEARYGTLRTTADVNHFLLKYPYTDNWEHECAEHYMPLVVEEYEQIFSLLGMELVHRESYRLPYLEGKWRDDFGYTDTELSDLVTTTILVARKGG